jgi:hypothetical protein
VFAEGYQFPVNFGGEITEDREIGGMDAQGGCGEEQARRER